MISVLVSDGDTPALGPSATEDDLKTQHSDTLKCLHMKESQIAVMCVRLQEAEEANIKKEARISELRKELEVMRNELNTRGAAGTPSELSSSLKKLQREREKMKEEFEKRECEYVKRLETANAENSASKKELNELKTKVMKMEMNEQSLSEEIRLAKYNLEANKHEFDEYKQRAQKILSAKENLLAQLKEVIAFLD
ncbi:unnamed protein product [Gongylonema pulchrum]|uniref:TACC_C domain-containing protein n=1 Tax=Gongylonema pulchrum TaxID=637853 RepID=A0A183D6B9_9BILA|nr:unnamed protein product [Gongylonema pulchrum]